MDDVAVERRLVAILAADIVGYSRLVEKDETATLVAIRRLRREVIDPLLAKYHGRIVKLMGDGAIVEFVSVVDAVRCAAELQKACAAAQADVPVDRRIVFRIGINLGDVVVEGDDLLGDGVNVAARLQEICEPAGVLVSGTAYDHLGGKFDLPLDFAGEQHVKNISHPVRTYQVRLAGSSQPWRLRARTYRDLMRVSAVILIAALAAGGWWWLRSGDTAIASPSIAVLPFDNLGGDETAARLAGGITEDIITDLARFRSMEVIARNSTMRYKGEPVDIRQVGRDLKVRYVLEGSIQHQNDNVRVTAQLIEAESGTHVWSDRWDRPVEDVFAIQSEIAETVATKLGDYTGTIMTADRDAAKRKRPNDLTAYDLYLLGIEAKHRMTKESTDEAIKLLKKSIEIDPNFARAWTGLGFGYSIANIWSDNWDETYALELAAARRAVELDPMDAEARSMLGFALAEGGDLAQSEVEIDKAMSLNPNSADVLTWFANWASAFGKPQAGAEAADRAIRLNPSMPVWAIPMYRSAYFMAGRYEDALRVHMARSKDLFYRDDYVYYAAMLAGLGRDAEAQAAMKNAMSLYPDTTIEGFSGWVTYKPDDRQRLIDTMRKAGFPVCVENPTPDIVRMQECVQAKAIN